MEQRLVQQGEVSLGKLREEYMAAMELLNTTLLTNHTKDMDTLRTNHKAELDSLLANHKAELKAMATEIATKHEELVALETSLESKRKSELDRLEAVLQETNQAQLEAQEAELEHRHQEEREELEKRMLGNMDTLETTYLREIQVRTYTHTVLNLLYLYSTFHIYFILMFSYLRLCAIRSLRLRRSISRKWSVKGQGLTRKWSVMGWSSSPSGRS